MMAMEFAESNNYLSTYHSVTPNGKEKFPLSNLTDNSLDFNCTKKKKFIVYKVKSFELHTVVPNAL